MANVKITDLTAYTDPLNTDVVPIVDVTNNVTKKVSIANMAKNVSLGTAALPGVAFDGDPNTGIYSPGADQIGIATGGTGRVFVSSAGLVGIGTTSPGTALDVNGTINVRTNGYEFGRITTNNNSANQGGLSFQYNNTGTFTTGITLNYIGNVGIGTTGPATLLDLSTTTSAKLNLTYPGFGIATLASDNTGSLLLQADEANTQASSIIQFKIDGTERARIDSSGRLLVGGSPDSGGALFQVFGDRIRIGTAKTPASAGATGTAGEICWDANYIYVCTATNTWKRTAISTW